MIAAGKGASLSGSGDRPRVRPEAPALADGTGLDAAPADAGVVVHCATDSRNDVAATRRLAEAARTRAGQR